MSNSLQLLATLWTVAHQAPLTVGFSRQEYWSGLPFPPPGDLPDAETEPTSPTLTGRFFSTEPPGSLSLSYMAFIMLRHVSPTPFVENYYKWMLSFVKCFFCICWDDHIFILHFNLVYHIDLWMLKYSCIPGVNSTWSWCMGPFDVFLSLIC